MTPKERAVFESLVRGMTQLVNPPVMSMGRLRKLRVEYAPVVRDARRLLATPAEPEPSIPAVFEGAAARVVEAARGYSGCDRTHDGELELVESIEALSALLTRSREDGRGPPEDGEVQAQEPLPAPLPRVCPRCGGQAGWTSLRVWPPFGDRAAQCGACGTRIVFQRDL